MADINVKLMTVLARMIKSLTDKVQDNLKSLGMSTTDFTILAALNEQDEIAMQKLGEIALITSGTITYAVNKLVKNGYVLKRQDESDKRIFWACITEHGRERFNEVMDEHLIFMNQLLGDFDESEKEQMIEMAKLFGKTIASK